MELKLTKNQKRNERTKRTIIDYPNSRGCEVIGCIRIHKAKGLCITHYKNFLNTGKRPTIIRKLKPKKTKEEIKQYKREYIKKYRQQPEGRKIIKEKEFKYKRSINGKYRNAKRVGLRRPNFTWNLSFEDYETLINSRCYYCYSDLFQETGVSLDRIDNSIKEYNISNVLPCCKVCNQVRGQYLTIQETKIAVQAVLNYRNSQNNS